MDRPGEKLRQARERLKLTYRDVVEASRKIAERRKCEEFAIALSRLADIENKGTLPTIYRLYTLCAIYRLDWKDVLCWYGIPLGSLPFDAAQIRLPETHMLEFGFEESAIPEASESRIDPDQTTVLSSLTRRSGKLPFSFLGIQDQRNFQYGFVGVSDWSMYPILHPGALVLIDSSRQKIAAEGWTSELDRPIYFLEHREGFYAGWCADLEGRLLLTAHPSSHKRPALFAYSDIDIVGQVTGVAMLLESRRRRHARTGTVPAKSPNL